METHYIVQSATAKMPASCWGRYGRIAVLEVDADVNSVSMISERAKGCYSIIETWEGLNIGKTARCAFNKALVEAESLANKLNNISQGLPCGR